MVAGYNAVIERISVGKDPTMPRRMPRALTLFCLWSAIALVQPAIASGHPATWATDRPHFLGYNAYFGELHQHTGYSLDGCGLPEQAITGAKGRGNDFLALTEHDIYINRPEIGSVEKGCRISQTDPHKWQTLQELADRYTVDGSFVVLRGYERTRDWGHLNVFNSVSVVSPLDLDEFYSWLAGQPADVIGAMPPPARKMFGGGWPPLLRTRLAQGGWGQGVLAVTHRTNGDG
mgnify:CR=1 FL=1